LPGVQEAEVNFAAGKLTVVGTIAPEVLQREARKVEAVTLHPEGAGSVDSSPSPWTADRHLWRTLVALAALLLALVFPSQTAVNRAFLFTAVAVGGYPLVLRGVRNLVRLRVDMHVLMTVAVAGALAIGEWNEAAVVVVLFALSERLEAYAMERARRSIRSLVEWMPKEATVLRDGRETVVPVAELAVGDLVLIRPGENIAVDGEVVEGTSAVNEAPITGEAMPVEKGPGDPVYAGTLNGPGALRVRVTKVVAESTLAKILHLVEEAQNRRAPAQAFVDRFARVYTPVVIALALGVALVPPLLSGGGWERWVYEGLALLVVACPCALVISTPVAVVTAIGAAARRGVLIKGGVHLEAAGRIRAVAFDKTGTLTRGQPTVTDVLPLGGQSVRDVLAVAAALEALSEHPVARAILDAARARGIAVEPAESFSAVPGKGAVGQIGGRTYLVGSPRLFTERGVAWEAAQATLAAWQEQGKTAILVGTEERLLGLIAVADLPREESAAVIRVLKGSGVVHTVMLTGDHRRTAEAVARQVGVDEVHAELLPEDKLQRIQALRRRYGTVAMVGDGINDAPALAAATVGVAMGGGGTDAALETADIVLMNDDLTRLPETVRLGRRALRVIRQNIAFSLVTKLVAVALVVPGWLTLWLAILADMGATLLVTANSLRLLRVKGA